MPKISWDGLDISEGYTGFTDGNTGSTAGAEPAAGAVPAAGAGSGDTVGLSVGSYSSIGGVKITFESFKEINKKKFF